MVFGRHVRRFGRRRSLAAPSGGSTGGGGLGKPDFGLGGNGTRAAAAWGAPGASNISGMRLGRIGVRVAKASEIRCNCATTLPSPITISPPTAADVPATMSEFPKLSSIEMPNPIVMAPNTRATAPTRYNSSDMGFSNLPVWPEFTVWLTSGTGVPAKHFYQYEILALSTAASNPVALK